MVRKIPLINTFLCYLLHIFVSSPITAQVDNFSNEEADFFRAKMIVPLASKEQDGDYPKSIYLIPHDITVPEGKSLTLFPGSTIFFKKDSRLIIKGKLISKGKMENPVLFNKLDNKDYYTPVDSMVDTKWDGIFVEESGKIELQYSHISNSKYGINIDQSVKEIILDSVQFHNNRYQDLKIGTEEIVINDSNYHFFQKRGQNQTLESPVTTETEKPVELIPQQKTGTSKKLRIIRIATATGTILGAASAVSGYFLHEKYYPLYNESGKDNVVKYRHLSLLGEGLRNAGAGVAGPCLIAFTISLFY